MGRQAREVESPCVFFICFFFYLVIFVCCCSPAYSRTNKTIRKLKLTSILKSKKNIPAYFWRRFCCRYCCCFYHPLPVSDGVLQDRTGQDSAAMALVSAAVVLLLYANNLLSREGQPFGAFYDDTKYHRCCLPLSVGLVSPVLCLRSSSEGEEIGILICCTFGSAGSFASGSSVPLTVVLFFKRFFFGWKANHHIDSRG